MVEIRPPASILAWLPGALGDTLLGYPALAALRSWAPAACITVVGRSSYLRFAVDCGIVDRIEDADGPFPSRIFSGEQAGATDVPELAVLWSVAHAELAARMVRLGVGRVIAASTRAGDQRHQSQYLLDTLAPLLGRRQAPLSLLPVQPATTRDLVPEPLRRAANAIILHPGAGSRWKRWPLGHYLALATALRRRGAVVRWSCGPDDGDVRSALLRAGQDDELLPKVDLPDFARMLSVARALVSADTGTAHLAALCGTPTVTIFSPTDPRRWKPLGASSAVIQARSHLGCAWECRQGVDGGDPVLALRRCTGQGDACPCLARISPEHVLRHLWQSQSGS